MERVRGQRIPAPRLTMLAAAGVALMVAVPCGIAIQLGAMVLGF